MQNTSENTGDSSTIATMADLLASECPPPRSADRNEVGSCLHAIAVGLVRLGPSAGYLAVARAVIVRVVDAWPVERRPTEIEISRAAGWAVERIAPAVKAREPDDGTEAAIAEHLALRTDLRQRLRCTYAGGRCVWMTWAPPRWMPAADPLPLPLQAAIRRTIADGLERRIITARAIPKLESASGMRGIATFLSSYPAMRLPDEIDPPGLFAMPGCVLGLRSGEQLPHDPCRPITRAAPVNPCPADEYWPIIEAHLRACLVENYDAAHRHLGSALLGIGADRKLLWLVGPGGDGKSTLARLLKLALGEYCAVVPAEVFQGQSRGAHLHELGSGLAGARLAVALEVSPGNLDWSRLKGLSGGDEQVSKRLYGRSFSYVRPPCLLLIANDPPQPPDRASAERVIVGSMSPPTDPDERIIAVLKGEQTPERDALAGACLRWLLDGRAAFLRDGLGPHRTAARDPVGLEAWWSTRVAEGGIVIGKTWGPIGPLRDDLASYIGTANPMPRDNELAAFLRGRVAFKRTREARLYQAVTPGDASFQPSHAHVGGLQQASPAVTESAEPFLHGERGGA